MGVVGLTATFVACRKHCLNEMHCAMCGMVFGMIPAFIVGTIHALSTGDFVWPIITGTIAGTVLGIPFGMIGGSMGRLEAVMAAPMAGIMGSMTGVMVRIYNVDLFMIAFAAIVLFVMGETAYMVYKTSGKSLDLKSMGAGGMLGLMFFAPITLLSFPIGNSDLQQLLQDGNDVLADVKEGVQEITLQMQRLGYEPSVLTLKKDVPVKLNLQADSDVGCTRAIVFPEFGINKVVQPGTSDVVEFTPQKEGQFYFSCSMGMVRGVVNVVP